MTGGIFNKTSAFALVAAAGLMMGGLTFATTSAKAADLGADDLEARVAELEATTVRKGNRKVSLELSGQVNRALVAWDDGVASDAYVLDNDQSSTRFRVKGTGTISSDLKAGFLIELGVNDSNSANVNQWDDDLPTDASTITTRQANVFIESKTFGRLTLGQGSPATDDLALINLGGSLTDAGVYFNTKFNLRTSTGGASGITWGDMAKGSTFVDSSRGDFVRYDTPALYGFILSAAWGENDVWDIALRFQKEFSEFRVAAGIGYYYNGDPYGSCTYTAGLPTSGSCDPRSGASARKFDKVIGAASAMHVPTGIFVSGAAGAITTYTGGQEYDSDFWYVQAGITKRFLDYGATTVYGEAGNYGDMAADGATLGGAAITGSNVDRYGAGIVQAFDGAGLEVYAQYHHYEGDVTTTTNRVSTTTSFEDWDAVVTGMKLKF
ncbi:porin [Rhodomicrobium udaipurense]|uniref:Porin domain-containing protein n=1 Tax=Rhodomicrobium udaipurense TaxID=1202716 RepID=A0A8I1GF64_9HYPH|nr:hypothetical protein [Rhodomicrobium udaipurense]MBJ7543674.1 hypothetical protein [Rhodomicrobium udaipurense]